MSAGRRKCRTGGRNIVVGEACTVGDFAVEIAVRKAARRRDVGRTAGSWWMAAWWEHRSVARSSRRGASVRKEEDGEVEVEAGVQNRGV